MEKTLKTKEHLPQLNKTHKIICISIYEEIIFKNKSQYIIPWLYY